jgi:uncharacterized protein (TIGR03435 family)
MLLRVLRLFAFVPFTVVFAQSAFEVASVKPSPPSQGDLLNINLGNASHGVVTLTNTTLSECIRYAYGLVSEDQISGPDWIHDRALRVDIVAKAPPDTPNDQLLLMTQNLLAERFRLALHREEKPISHLELVVAKAGLKMPETAGDKAVHPPEYRRGRLHYSHITTHTLAVLLSRQLRQLVRDNTALTAFYDVNLDWSPEDQPSDLFTAIQQQIGLKLEASKAPIDVLTIDHAEKVPISN